MATRILLAHHSVGGHTAAIAERILGGSIHMSRHSKSLIAYARAHAAALAALPAGLFQVSLTSATRDEAHDRHAQDFVEGAIEQTGWDPDIVGVFAGAILYTQYGWFKRHLMKAITAREGGPTDTSRDYDFTDWPAVDQFADDAADPFGNRLEFLQPLTVRVG